MEGIHMGQLLEGAIRRKGLNITQIASALNVTRRTLYNWFKQETIDEFTMERIANVVSCDFFSIKPEPAIATAVEDGEVVKDDAYWKDRYIDLLERYSELINAKRKLNEVGEMNF